MICACASVCTCLVSVLQDNAVPVCIGQQLFEQLPAQGMVLTLVKDGDHRLARPQDIRLMLNTLDGLVHGL